MLARIRELGIPPAWKDVWICPSPRGHLQATGTDAAGRKQYLYHEQWRVRRDAEKFTEMARFAHALPDLREHVQADIDGDGFTRARVLACAVRLLDRGFFRIGSEEYTVENESFGLATMRKSHVTIGADGAMEFDYPAKSGQRRVQAVVDPQAGEIVAGAQAPPRRRRRPARVQGRAALARRPLGRHQRVHQGGDGRRLLREGLPHLERDRARRGRAVGVGRGRRLGEPAASERSRARSRRSPTTSATRRRCAAPPTSIRACSTPTAAGS